MNLFCEIVIILIVLAAMVLVLLAIRQLAHFESFDDAEETRNLRDEVNEDGNIITRNNVFSTLVEADPEDTSSHNKLPNHKIKDDR